MSALLTRPQIQIRIADIAKLTTDRDKVLTRINRINALLAKTIGARLQNLNRQIQEKQNEVLAWARSNPNEFGDKKSIEFLSGVIESSDGPQKVILLSNWTDELCLKALNRFRKWKKLFIRDNPELNRQSILAEHKAERLKPEIAEKFGVRIGREIFYSIKLKTATTSAPADSALAKG